MYQHNPQNLVQIEVPALIPRLATDMVIPSLPRPSHSSQSSAAALLLPTSFLQKYEPSWFKILQEHWTPSQHCHTSKNNSGKARGTNLLFRLRSQRPQPTPNHQNSGRTEEVWLCWIFISGLFNSSAKGKGFLKENQRVFEGEPIWNCLEHQIPPLGIAGAKMNSASSRRQPQQCYRGPWPKQ